MTEKLTTERRNNRKRYIRKTIDVITLGGQKKRVKRDDILNVEEQINIEGKTDYLIICKGNKDILTGEKINVCSI